MTDPEKKPKRKVWYRRDLSDLKRLKDLKKDAIEIAAQSIANYIKRKGLTEFPTITTKHFNQKGYINVYIKPHPESQYSCIVELNYNYPNKYIREEIRSRVIERVRGLL